MKYQVLNHIFEGIEIFSKLEEQDFITHLKDFLEEYERNGFQTDIISKIEDEDDKQEILEFFQNFKESLSKATSKFDALHFMADNFSTSLKQEYASLQERQLQERLSLELRRESFLSLLSQIPQEKLQESENGKTILHKIIGIPKSFGKEIILEIISKSEDLSQYYIALPGSDQEVVSFPGSEQSILEYFISQVGFGEEDTFVSEIAIALFEKGCKFEIDVQNPENLMNLLKSRSIKSNLLKNLCLYFIEQHQDPALFFEIVRYYNSLEKQPHGQSRRDSRSSSRASSSFQGALEGYVVLKKELSSTFKKIIDEIIKNGKINVSKDSKKQETVPAFFLRKSAEQVLEENNLISDLWLHIQRRDNSSKLKPELFLQQDYLGLSFLHRIVDSRNAELLLFAVAKIQESQNKPQIQEILNLRSYSGRNAFHLACINGFDNAIEILAPISEVNEVDLNDRTPLMDAVATGKSVSVKKLLQIPEIDIESSNSRRRPIFTAVKNNQESVAIFLLEKDANPNGISIIIDEEGNRHEVSPIMQAIENQNFESVQALVKYGAIVYDEQENYLENFQEYFETLSEEQKVQIEKYARLNQSFKSPVLKLIEKPQENSVDEEMLEKMQDFYQNNQFKKAFEFYHQALEEKRNPPRSSPLPTSSSTVGQPYSGRE